MKYRKLLISMTLILAVIAGCKKDKQITAPPVGPPGDTTVVTPPPTPQPYTITEDFETGSKTAYAAADVQLTSGLWNFNDGLIGNLPADVKDGTKSVRLRTGDITMKFDIKGVTSISIKHAKYGNDGTSTWQLLMSTDSGTTFTQLGADINETSTILVTDSFKVNTTAKVRFQIKKQGTNRINIDDITFKGLGDPGIVVGAPDTSGTGDGGNTGTAAPGRGITYDIDAPPSTGDNSNLLLGNPSAAQSSVVLVDNYLIDQKYYTESYSSTRGTPNWVSWHLDATNITNASARLDNFAGFTGLPAGFFEVESNAFSGSGFDRGHNCPSADRTSSADANSATFLMTNMIPQAPQNNQQTWANFENYLREQVVEGNEVYIIMGSYGTGGTGSKGSATKIDDNHVTVPSNVWKIAVIEPKGDNDISRINASTRVIAINTPNVNTTSSDWKQYRVTVRDIEAATSYNLLSNLPQTVQDAIETKKDNL